MTNAIPFPSQLAPFREYAIKALMPFFLDIAEDEPHAQLIARQSLEEHQAHSPIEIQFSAQFIATTIATLACLRTAIAATKLPLEKRLALQQAALMLEKQGAAAKKVLGACRDRRTAVAAIEWDNALFQGVLGSALDHLKEANAIYAAHGPVAVAKPAAPPPRPARPELVFDSAEPMTQAVLARRAAAPRKRRCHDA
jgi:hypothetical protein